MINNQTSAKYVMIISYPAMANWIIVLFNASKIINWLHEIQFPPKYSLHNFLLCGLYSEKIVTSDKDFRDDPKSLEIKTPYEHAYTVSNDNLVRKRFR